jgi:hypothetical protein
MWNIPFMGFWRWAQPVDSITGNETQKKAYFDNEGGKYKLDEYG